VSEYPSLVLVFIAGLLSFFSPCVLPLIPSFLSVLGGVPVSGEINGERPNRFRLLSATVSFILGFTAVFIFFSIIISATFWLMGGISKYIRIAAGITVIVLGLNVIFDFLSFLNYEKKLRITGKNARFRHVRTFLTGAAFAAGWTPCIGPILASVLFLAGQSGRAGLAALYLAIYSFGLGVPFLLAAAFFDRFLVTKKWFRDHAQVIKIASGILLLFIGILILTGRFSALNITLQRWQFQYIDWSADKALPFRVFGSWLEWLLNL